MLKDAREISRGIDTLFEACENVRDHDGCAECPITFMCLNDPEVCFMDLVDGSTASIWDEFLNYADNVEYSEEQRRVQYAESRREMARDDALLDSWEK